MIKTNQGSRFFQKIFFFSPLSQSDLECLLNIIVTHIEEVLCDFYANYFLQKLLPYCTLQNRILLYKVNKKSLEKKEKQGVKLTSTLGTITWNTNKSSSSSNENTGGIVGLGKKKKKKKGNQ